MAESFWFIVVHFVSLARKFVLVRITCGFAGEVVDIVYLWRLLCNFLGVGVGVLKMQFSLWKL